MPPDMAKCSGGQNHHRFDGHRFRPKNSLADCCLAVPDCLPTACLEGEGVCSGGWDRRRTAGTKLWNSSLYKQGFLTWEEGLSGIFEQHCKQNFTFVPVNIFLRRFICPVHWCVVWETLGNGSQVDTSSARVHRGTLVFSPEVGP